MKEREEERNTDKIERGTERKKIGNHKRAQEETHARIDSKRKKERKNEIRIRKKERKKDRKDETTR